MVKVPPEIAKIADKYILPDGSDPKEREAKPRMTLKEVQEVFDRAAKDLHVKDSIMYALRAHERLPKSFESDMDRLIKEDKLTPVRAYYVLTIKEMPEHIARNYYPNEIAWRNDLLDLKQHRTPATIDFSALIKKGIFP